MKQHHLSRCSFLFLCRAVLNSMIGKILLAFCQVVGLLQCPFALVGSCVSHPVCLHSRRTLIFDGTAVLQGWGMATCMLCHTTSSSTGSPGMMGSGCWTYLQRQPGCLSQLPNCHISYTEGHSPEPKTHSLHCLTTLPQVNTRAALHVPSKL